jgi:antitoxin CptB
MSDGHTDLDDLRSERQDMRRKRLLFQCWHRGTQENDLILGSFAETSLARFDSTQLDQFEALLDCTDADLFDWIIGGSAPPQHDHDVMRLLRKFCTRTANTRAIR